MRALIKLFIRDESAATPYEFGLIAASVAVVVVGIVNTIGGQLESEHTALPGGRR